MTQITDGLKVSGTEFVKSGVPQDLVLGSGFFLSFINDLPLHLETDTEFCADDTAVHAADKSLEVVEIKLQNSASNFDFWCVYHNMFISYIKTHLMILGLMDGWMS